MSLRPIGATFKRFFPKPAYDTSWAKVITFRVKDHREVMFMDGFQEVVEPIDIIEIEPKVGEGYSETVERKKAELMKE